MIRTAIAIALNWAVLTAFVLLTGIHNAWPLYLAADAATAFVILYQPAGRMQALIGWTYMAQIMIHVIFATSNPILADYPYWELLLWIAWVQLALLGGWIGGRWLGYPDRGDRLVPAGTHGGAGMAS